MTHSASSDGTRSPGRVYLIGAGPGDPRLITLRGLECLRLADVVIYDYLASPELLREAQPGATLIYAGKRGGNHALRQTEINRLLVQYARDGHTVARLKGGDPFVFGRGGEEAEVLTHSGIPWEVVPGVSAAVAVPAYAGIPVTHREYSASLAILTGHEDPTKPQQPIEWQKLATGVDTLVVLMGVTNLEAIIGELLRHGCPPTRPAALVEWGTTRRQRTITGTLGSIFRRAVEVRLRSPATLIVGEAVTLREHLRWFDTAPLAGYRILLVAPNDAPTASLLGALQQDGADAELLFPRRDVSAPPVDEQQARAVLATCDWLVLAGGAAVSELRHLLWRAGQDWRALNRTRIVTLDQEAETALTAWGLRADLRLTQRGTESSPSALPFEEAGNMLVIDPLYQAAPSLQSLAASGHHVTFWRGVHAPHQHPGVSENLLLDPRPDAMIITSPDMVDWLSQACCDAGIRDIPTYFAGTLIATSDERSEQACQAAGLPTIQLPAVHPGNHLSAELAAALTAQHGTC